MKHSPLARDAGTTLVELLVTMVIAGLVVPLIIGVVIGAQRHTVSTMNTASAVASTRLALQDIDRQVRSGAGPVHVGTRAFGFWTAFAADGIPVAVPHCVQYRIDGSTLQRRSFPTGGTRPGWAAVGGVESMLAAGSTFAADGAGGASIEAELVVQVSADRPVTVASVLTPRNTATTSTTDCGAFS